MSDFGAKRILVTGGTGFIGRYVVRALEARGARPVVTTSGEAAATSGSNGHIGLDLTSASMTRQVIERIRPEAVLHLGGLTGGGHSEERYHAVNYLGTVNLLEALAGSGVERVVLLGSAAEYGPQPVPFRETMELRPVSPYAASKARANEYALERSRDGGVPVTVLRVFTAYGIGQPRKMFLSQLIASALLNQHFKMSDGLQKRDFVYVEDVAAAILSSLTARNAVGRVINIAGGRGVALRDLAARVWHICDADPERLEIGVRTKTDDDAFDTEADISLAAELLGWRPQAPPIDAEPCPPLVEMIEAMRHESPQVPAAAAQQPVI